jgi:hypothetical protein
MSGFLATAAFVVAALFAFLVFVRAEHVTVFDIPLSPLHAAYALSVLGLLILIYGKL